MSAVSRSVRNSALAPPRSSTQRTIARSVVGRLVGREADGAHPRIAEDRDEGREVRHPIAERPDTTVSPVALGLDPPDW
jgi:hypothetical protein